MRTLFFIIYIFYLTSCTERKVNNNNEKTSTTTKKKYHSINAFGSVRDDTSNFERLNCGLYINKNGILAYKAVDNSYRGDSTINGGKPLDVYLSTIYYADQSDTIDGGLKEMKDVVDTSTFQILGTFYFRDKNNIYVFNPMSDGGTIALHREIDRLSFRLLESEFYAKDKKRCYYRGRTIEGADVNSFKTFDTSFSWHIAYDKNNYYEREDKLSKDEIKEYNLDSIRKKKNGL
jgi:hypothetical protein